MARVVYTLFVGNQFVLEAEMNAWEYRTMQYHRLCNTTEYATVYLISFWPLAFGSWPPLSSMSEKFNCFSWNPKGFQSKSYNFVHFWGKKQH